jgi:3-hydroxyacyl-CoA dehydrogenase
VVEIHRGKKTLEKTVETARELMLKIGKKPVLVRKTMPGFIVNRLTGALEREIDYLLDEGVVTPEELDMAIKGSIGFRMACLGPQETEDMIGLDTAMMVSKRIYRVLSNATEPSNQLVEKVQKGELGIKSGKGWYDYKGKSSNEVLNENNRKLLQQLAVFRQREK